MKINEMGKRLRDMVISCTYSSFVFNVGENENEDEDQNESCTLYNEQLS